MESNRTGLESCLRHLPAGLLGTHVVTLTLGSTAWKMVIIRTLVDYCRITWGTACKVLNKYPSRQVLLRTWWLLPWQPAQARSIFHTACQELPPAPTVTRFIVDVWLFTEKPATWLPGQSCPSYTPLLSPNTRVWDVTNHKTSLKMFEVRLHSPILRPLSNLPHGAEECHLVMGWLSLCASETFWGRACRMSPSRSWVSLQPPPCLPPVSSLLCTAGNMTPSPGARLNAHKPVTECVYHPERNTLIKYIAGVSNPQVEKFGHSFL